jgi:hypothetical protein
MLRFLPISRRPTLRPWSLPQESLYVRPLALRVFVPTRPLCTELRWAPPTWKEVIGQARLIQVEMPMTKTF